MVQVFTAVALQLVIVGLAFVSTELLIENIKNAESFV
jgi:hypothetical protein